MIYSYTRMASFMLAFGLFFSCATIQSTNQSSDNTQDLSKRQLQQQIKSVDQQITETPNNPELYFQKGKLITKLARQTAEPTRRTPSYSEAQKVLAKASELFNRTGQADTEKVRNLLKVTWSHEHNQGVRLLQDETPSKSDYSLAIAHFENATTIIPDSAVSYIMKARTQYQNQQPLYAIETLEEAKETISNPPLLLLEQLAFLYLENKEPQKAIAVYEQAESFSNQNLNVLHGLSNAYIQAGRHGRAIALLEQLIKNEPQNIIYGQSLATEYYFLGISKMDSVATQLKEGQPLDNSAFTTADSLLKQAEEHFQRIIGANPADEELKQQVVTFYHNSASKYQVLADFASDVHRKKLQERVGQYLSSSIPLLESMVEHNPENQQAWKKLYRAYSILGMEQEAKKAKANL